MQLLTTTTSNQAAIIERIDEDKTNENDDI